MKKGIQNILAGFVAVAVLSGVSLLAAPLTYAAPSDVLEDSCKQAGQAGTDFCEGQKQDLFAPDGLFFNIIDVLIYVIGAVAVVMVVIGGFRYVTSGGDSSQVTAAKNTIMYAIIGVVIAILSYAIVNFVITSF